MAIALQMKMVNLCRRIFVSTGNNHHSAIFVDGNGNMQEHVVSFYEATARAVLGYDIVDKNYKSEEGWKFLFSIKQNEYFVFPNTETGFDPSEIDLMAEKNYKIISPNLVRVQKFTNGDYVFRHHLETNVEQDNNLKGITWIRIRSLNNLKGIVKVRINNIGKIVQIGEY